MLPVSTKILLPDGVKIISVKGPRVLKSKKEVGVKVSAEP